MPITEVRSPNRVLRERIRFVASVMVIIFIVSWIGWFYPYDDLLDRSGTPLGADFAMFYVAGQVVFDGAGDRLYDQAEHQRRLQQIFPAIDPDFALPYRYPPCVATILSPLAALPYTMAYAVFLCFSLVAWWTAARQLVMSVAGLRAAWRRSLCWAMLGWPVALETIIGGQASMFMLLIAVSVYLLLRNQRFVFAGAILALAAYKPNVLALLTLGCLIRYPRMLQGFVPVVVGVGIVCLVPDGVNGLIQYGDLTAHLATQTWDVATPFWKVHGLTPWVDLLVGRKGRLACTLMGIAATLFVTLRAKRVATRDGIEPLWFAVLISINAVFNAYVPIYDLVLLMIGAVLTTEHLSHRHGPNVGRTLVAAQVLLGIVYFGPHISQTIARSSGMQPFGLVLALIAIWQGSLLLRSARGSSTTSSQLLPSVSG